MLMKRLLCRLTLPLAVALVSFLLSSPALASGKTDFDNETLHYTVTYKWGLIHKDAGEATLSLRNRGDVYDLKLTGKTKPWADKVYQVRDTLTSTVAKEGFKPLKYVRVAREGGKYSRDVIDYVRGGSVVRGDIVKMREKKGKVKSLKASLTAQGDVYDMLSVFYYLRTLDYSSLAKGRKVTTTLFSGNKKETVTITSLGPDQVKMRDGRKRDAFHIKFRFTSGNGKKSSDDIEAWLSRDASRVPLVLVGKLPIGTVRCYLD